MGMLDRYRKSGGFVQLVTLLETCGPTKQEKFLEIIRQEASPWADELKTKILTIERIYSWNNETAAEIVGTLQDLTLAVAISAAPNELKERLFGMLSHGRRRKVDEYLTRTPPTGAEVATMHMKIIETVRKMANDGFLRFEKFDPSLLIEDGIEERLDKRADPAVTSNTASLFTIEYDPGTNPESSSTTFPASDDARSGEVFQMRKKLAEMSKENAVLRHELNIARTKLDQIRKIA